MIKYQDITTEEIFEEEEARENVWMEMTWDDYEEYFKSKMNFHDFFTRVRESIPDFYEKFENEFCDAENEYFEARYKEVEVPDEEEEQALPPILF